MLAPAGLVIEITPGNRVVANLRRDEEKVYLSLDMESEIGHFDAVISTSIETFDRVVLLANKHKVIPRLSDLIEKRTGRRLLLTR